jgi:hypothetical protein
MTKSNELADRSKAECHAHGRRGHAEEKRGFQDQQALHPIDDNALAFMSEIL